MKKFKNMKKQYGYRILSALMAVLFISTQVMTAQAVKTVTFERDENGAAISLDTLTSKKVNFSVELKTVDDTIEVYKIAATSYNAGTGEYKLDWSTALTQTLKKQIAFEAGFSEDLGDGNIQPLEKYSSPEKLGKLATKGEITDFYQWIKVMIKNPDGLQESANPLGSVQAIPTSNIEYDKADPATPLAKVKNVSTGVYVIYATQGSGETASEYSPITCMAVPMQKGPDNQWYISDDYTGDLAVSLKFSGTDIKKYMSVNQPVTCIAPYTQEDYHGEDLVKWDTVAQGDEVTYYIFAGVPSYAKPTYIDEQGVEQIKYKADGTTLDYSGYWLNVVDTMGQGFTDMPDTIEIWGAISTNVEENTDRPGSTRAPDERDISYDVPINNATILFAEAGKDNTLTSQGVRWYTPDVRTGNEKILVNVSADGQFYDVYAYNPDIVTSTMTTLKSNTLKLIATGMQTSKGFGAATAPNNSPYAATTMVDAYNQAMGYVDDNAPGKAATNFIKDDVDTYKDIRVISFDYAELYEQGIREIAISYRTTANTQLEIGTNGNINRATLYYDTGNVSKKEDEVIAWTYAIKLVKEDGNQSGHYIAGAEFDLYKEAYLYVPKDGTLMAGDGTQSAYGTTAADYKNYKFSQRLHDDNNLTVVPEDTLAAPIMADDGQTVDVPAGSYVPLANLEYANNAQTDYYFRVIHLTVAQATAETCTGADGNGCLLQGVEHNHMIVYKQLKLKYYDEDTDSEVYFSSLAGNEDGKIVSTNTEDGVLIKGLEPSRYVMIETKAPDGYNALTEAIAFEINTWETDAEAKEFDTGAEAYTIGSRKACYSEIYGDEKKDVAGVQQLTAAYHNNNDKAYAYVYEDGTYPIKVKNYTGIRLPETGGMGTLIFTIIGILVMLTTTVVVVLKKKNRTYETQF